MRISIISLALLAACGGAVEAPIASQSQAIRPTDFAILPCGSPDDFCLEVQAGGKRLIFGAPVGVADSLTPETLSDMEAVFLFSMRYSDLQGIDELRNKSWLAGRDTPLRVAGPDGLEQLVQGLNSAFEVSDAFAFVTERPAGGFDAAILTPLPGAGEAEVLVFTTGDLEVTKLETPHGTARYLVDYLGHVAVLEACGMTEERAAADFDAYVLSCSVENGNWPLTGTHFIYRE